MRTSKDREDRSFAANSPSFLALLPRTLQTTVDSPDSMPFLKSDNSREVLPVPPEATTAASRAVANELRRLNASRGRAVALFDSFTQPVEFFAQLVAEPEIDWTQIIVFQAGELIGESADSPASCQRFITEHVLLRVPIVSFHAMRGDAANQEAAAANFSQRLAELPPDLAFVSSQLLDAIRSSSSSEMVARTLIAPREAITITPSVLFSCPSLFVLGGSRIAELAASHPNAHSFLYANP